MAFFANIVVFLLTIMVKQTFSYQLLQLHQFFTTIINVAHMVWIPLNYDEDKYVLIFSSKIFPRSCFATPIPSNSDVAIVSLVYFCWYSCPPVVLLLSLSRYLETRKQEKLMEHPNKVIVGVCGIALIPCLIFPFSKRFELDSKFRVQDVPDRTYLCVQ